MHELQIHNKIIGTSVVIRGVGEGFDQGMIDWFCT